MKNKFAVVFGAVIACILLMLYAGTVAYMIWQVHKWSPEGADEILEFPNGLIVIVTTIGGLVSALVVAKLAITKPKESPFIMSYAVRDDKTQSKWVTGIAIAYLTIWLIVGLASLIVGVMLNPEVNQALNDIGTTWLGLAVASGYAYFGITPDAQ